MILSKLRHNRSGFTLVEIMIVVAIIALLAAIAVPNFLRARKRSQATHILQDLRIVDAAIDQYAIENDKKASDFVGWDDVIKYVKQGSRLYNSSAEDLLGHYFIGGIISEGVKVSEDSFNDLSDVAPLEFWSPFGVGSSGLP